MRGACICEYLRKGEGKTTFAFGIACSKYSDQAPRLLWKMRSGVGFPGKYIPYKKVLGIMEHKLLIYSSKIYFVAFEIFEEY